MAAKTPLALIHGGLGRAANWRPFLSAFGGDVSPLLIELPGHGLAEEFDETRDYSDQAVEIALDEMPSDPVPLIGHAFGAALALKIAIERPSRVKSLVLVEPVFFAAIKGRWEYDKIVRDLAPFRKKIEAAENATAVREFHKVWSKVPWNDLPSEQRAYMMARVGLLPEFDTLIFDDLAGLLGSGRLEGLEMPVTFVDGGDTHPSIAEIISTVGDRMPDAEWITVKGASHDLPMTHPEQLVKAIDGRLFI